jgi:hypothetical protein
MTYDPAKEQWRLQLVDVVKRQGLHEHPETLSMQELWYLLIPSSKAKQRIPTREEQPDIHKRIYDSPPPKPEKKKRNRIDIVLEKMKEKKEEQVAK